MANILLKNIPDHLHAEIKKRAKKNHRSINGEIISCLEQVVAMESHDPLLQIEKVRMMRKNIGGYLTEELLSELKNKGRSW